MSKERRQALRTTSAVPLEIYDPKGRMVVGEGRFLNLSTLGGLMESPKPLKAKTSIRLHMVPAGKTSLEILGRVVWARKGDSAFTYGIRFSQREPSPAN
jgi:hypothetical protein